MKAVAARLPPSFAAVFVGWIETWGCAFAKSTRRCSCRFFGRLGPLASRAPRAGTVEVVSKSTVIQGIKNHRRLYGTAPPVATPPVLHRCIAETACDTLDG